MEKGWSQRAAMQMPLQLAESTRALYNRILTKLQVFCGQCNCQFPPSKEAVLVDFLCTVADGSEKPSSQLRCTLAAVGNVYRAMSLPNLADSGAVKGFVCPLTKSQTTQPRERSRVMPPSAFTNLHNAWPDNEHLSTKQLRMKAISLLALSLLLRLSDIAPKAVKFDPESKDTNRIVFSEDLLQFNSDGSLVVTFLGIKNDTDRSGAVVSLPPARDSKVDPIQGVL